MQYALLIYEDERVYENESAYKAIVDQHRAFAGQLAAAGKIRGGAELRSVSTATTIRQSGQGAPRSVHDGPFAETREQLGGFYLIEAEDLDEAIAWAKKLPLWAAGCVEVRPVGEG